MHMQPESKSIHRPVDLHLLQPPWKWSTLGFVNATEPRNGCERNGAHVCVYIYIYTYAEHSLQHLVLVPLESRRVSIEELSTAAARGCLLRAQSPKPKPGQNPTKARPTYNPQPSEEHLGASLAVFLSGSGPGWGPQSVPQLRGEGAAEMKSKGPCRETSEVASRA